MPRDPEPAETVLLVDSRSDEKLYGTLCLKWSSVLELCYITLQIRTQALLLWARISLTSWYIPIKIVNATQFVVC